MVASSSGCCFSESPRRSRERSVPDAAIPIGALMVHPCPSVYLVCVCVLLFVVSVCVGWLTSLRQWQVE